MPSTRCLSLILPLLASSVSGFMPSAQRAPLSAMAPRVSSSLRMALDYNDPAVAEEFAAVQAMDYDDVLAELLETSIIPPAGMGDAEVRLWLVELRGMKKAAKAAKPEVYQNKFDEYYWEKPAFAELWERIKKKGDVNEENVCVEYCVEPEIARQRYSVGYTYLMDEIDAIVNAKPEVTSPTVRFSGFPSTMGDQGLMMTLQALGEVVDLSCDTSEDGRTLIGEVTFGSIDSAKAAIDQYDGMDMGVGDKLQMTSC
ncbi:hypothetical protein ACHAWO_004391 [Cyclotella atomus]|uniref:RRM domain-containing protein n=1 Tax=Cyclotella atomus TaxID=382360 RepID=A0ABD3MUQ4_9STRA